MLICFVQLRIATPKNDMEKQKTTKKRWQTTFPSFWGYSRFSLAMAWPKEDQTSFVFAMGDLDPSWRGLAYPGFTIFYDGQRGYSTEHPGRMSGWYKCPLILMISYDHEKHTQSHKLPLTNTVLLGTMFWVRFGVNNIIYKYSWFSLGEPSPWIKQRNFRTNLCRSQLLLLVNNVNIPYQDIIFLIRRRHYLQSHSTVTPIMF